MKHNSQYFYGNKISDYGIKHGYVDYRTLSRCFDAVLNNNIISNTQDIGYWEQISGFVEEEDDREIFQYFIVSDNAVSILTDANEIVFYNEELDMNVWGVTHYGTGWDYVLTNIKLE